jgi:hypothetical protein
MPSFFGDLFRRVLPILIPVFVIVIFVFFAGGFPPGAARRWPAFRRLIPSSHGL